MNTGKLEWKIKPLRGLGPLSFGSSPAEVAQRLNNANPVTDTRVMFDGSTSEFRGLGFPVCSYQDGNLRGVDTDFRVENVLLGDLNIYLSDPRDAITESHTPNGGMKFGVGILLFEKISISTTGFFVPKKGFFRGRLNADQDDWTLGVCHANAFDPLLSQFRDVKLPAN